MFCANGVFVRVIGTGRGQAEHPLSPRHRAKLHSASAGHRRPLGKSAAQIKHEFRVKANSDTGMQNSARSKGSAWVSSGVLLAAGGALPGLLLPSRWQQGSATFNIGTYGFMVVILLNAERQECFGTLPELTFLLQVTDLGAAYQSVSLLSVDTAFIITATAFLTIGSRFGHQRYGDTPTYPGIICILFSYQKSMQKQACELCSASDAVCVWLHPQSDSCRIFGQHWQ